MLHHSHGDSKLYCYSIKVICVDSNTAGNTAGEALSQVRTRSVLRVRVHCVYIPVVIANVTIFFTAIEFANTAWFLEEVLLGPFFYPELALLCEP